MQVNGDGADIYQTANRDAYLAFGNISINVNNRRGAAILAVEDKIARLVMGQAEEKRSRLIGIDFPGGTTANVEYSRIPGRINGPSGHERGDLRSVLEFFQSLSPGRLVIIGAPGAGKTVLLLELQIRLLEERQAHPEIPIPVLVSASAYDTPGKWDDWLAEQISLDFGLRKRKAAELVSSRRVLPLIDGLDEMDPAGNRTPERAQALVRSLNWSVRGREHAPVVVTCRPGEYGRLARNGIEEARHVELAALSGAETGMYIREQLSLQDELDSWAPVLDTLERDPDGPLAAELATPWRLTMALATFRGGDDPARLLPQQGMAGSRYSEYINGMLLDNYVRVTVSLRNKKRRPYAEEDVRRWLTNLADGLGRQARHGRSATDITLHEWRHFPGELATKISYAALILFPFLAFALIGVFTHDHPLLAATLGSIIILGMGGSFFPQERKIPKDEKGMARVASGLVNGIAAGIPVSLVIGLTITPDTAGIMAEDPARIAGGLTFGFTTACIVGLTAALTTGLRTGIVASVVIWLPNGLLAGVIVGFLPEGRFGFLIGVAIGGATGLVIGLTAGLTAGLTSKFTNFSAQARRPQAIIQANRRTGLASGLFIGAAIGLLAGLAGNVADGVTVGLTFGIGVWLAISARISMRYHSSVAWNVFRGKSPLRFMKFLDWATEAGLLRESGISYQFRHRQLQDRLTSLHQYAEKP